MKTIGVAMLALLTLAGCNTVAYEETYDSRVVAVPRYERPVYGRPVYAPRTVYGSSFGRSRFEDDEDEFEFLNRRPVRVERDDRAREARRRAVSDENGVPIRRDRGTVLQSERAGFDENGMPLGPGISSRFRGDSDERQVRPRRGDRVCTLEERIVGGRRVERQVCRGI